MLYVKILINTGLSYIEWNNFYQANITNHNLSQLYKIIIRKIASQIWTTHA